MLASPAKPAPRMAHVDDVSELHSGPAAIVAARARERQRMADIMVGTAGQRCPALAQRLAFHSRTPADEALAILEAQPAAAPARKVVDTRSARPPN